MKFRDVAEYGDPTVPTVGTFKFDKLSDFGEIVALRSATLAR
jgi:hypothetical protein